MPFEQPLSPFCHPERTRISYVAALNSGHICDSPEREAHALYRYTTVDRKFGEAEGPAVRFGHPESWGSHADSKAQIVVDVVRSG